jgi:hypothetical protein
MKGEEKYKNKNWYETVRIENTKHNT